MSYCFGVSYEKPSSLEAKRRQQIATEHGSDFVEINVVRNTTPSVNNGYYQAWFEGPNRGDPFNGRLATAVLTAIAGDRQ